MFSFLKRNKSTINKHFRNFQDQFSENQKKAIMCSLLIIANSDGEFHRKEAQFLKEVARALGYHLSDVNLKDFMSIGPEGIFQILDSLDDGQKDWYIITAFAMLHVDGHALEVEFQYLEAYFGKMGITRKRFESVANKSQLLINEIVYS
jgi:hypothetical protein